MNRRSTAAALLTVALASALPAAAQTELRWKFTEGKKMNYTMSQDIVTTANIGEQKIETTMNQVITMTWAVDKLNSDGSAKMTQTIDRMQMTVKSPAGEMTFDSKVPAKMIEAGKNAGPAGAMLSEGGLKNMVTQGSLSFPENALKKDDTWKKQMSIDMPNVGKMVIDTTYKYAGPGEEGTQKIEADLNTKIENSSMGLEVKNQKANATFFFDNDKGVLRRSQVSQDMTLSGEAGGQSFSQDIKTKVSLKLDDGASPKKSE
jgi:hypothetical protein